MTTLSTQTPLPNSLMRTSRAAGSREHHGGGTVQESAGDGHGHDGDANDHLLFEDEEIASVEADGMHSNDGGPAEKQMLTAALVTSIVESAGTAPTSREPGCINSRKRSREISGATMKGGKRSPRRRQHHQQLQHQHPKPGILGASSSSSSVPNPLAGILENSMPLKSNSMVVTKRTDTLMSAAPNVQLGNQFSTIAQSMSSQKYQTDGLAAASLPSIGGGVDAMPQVRGRIFSIDLDPAVLDFVENVVDPLAGDRYSSSVTFKDPPDMNTAGRPHSNSRERGYSFEFFAFGFNDDEPLPPISSMPQAQGGNLNRPRGDSIIFDPDSFRDGGIHETSALMHIKTEGGGGGHQQQLQQIPERFPIAPMSAQLAPPASAVLLPPITTSIGPTPDFTSNKSYVATSIHGNVRPYPKLRDTAKSSLSVNARLPKSAVLSGESTSTVVVSSRSIPQQAFSDTTIHMPHGSDAAAAAAAGMPHTSPSSPHEGQHSLSHIDCPMELLNKGGRIGIYLPEERKARIAKFHSKRKIRIWRKRIKYDCRKKLADSRPRVKGRFVKRSDVD